jgi:hypothetical protein
MYELTKKKFFEAAGIEVELCENGEYKPKKGFLLDKPVKRITQKSPTLKSIEKKVKSNQKKAKKDSLKEFFEVAGVLDQTLAQQLIEADTENKGN